MRNSMKSQRLALTLLIALIGVLIVIFSLIEFQERRRSEKDTLANQAKLVSANLELHMRSANQVLEEIQALHDFTTLDALRERMQSLVNAMPIIRGIGLLDRKGGQVTGTRMVAMGTNFGDRPYFRNVQLNPQRHRLYISTPFRSLTGQVSIALSKAILNDQNVFEGVVFAVLEPDYIEMLMSSTLYTPDMWAALIHQNSQDALIVGASPFETRSSFDSEHDLRVLLPELPDAPSAAFVWDNFSEAQMIATSTISGYAGNSARSLQVVMGRSYSEALAGWIRLAYIQAGLFILFALMAYGGLLFYQQRRMQYDSRRAADLRLIEAREHDYRLIVERTADCVVRLDTAGNFYYANPAFVTLFGSVVKHANSNAFLELVLEDDRSLAEQALRLALSQPSGEQRVQLRCKTQRGAHHMEWTLCSIPGESGQVEGVIGVGRDVSAHIALNKELRNRAEHDSLTGLSNRGHFLEIAANAVNVAQTMDHPLALLMIDLDHFKKVNDTWGHQAGDIALQSCAKTLIQHCREQDIAARLGGEEFTLLVSSGRQEASLVAERIRLAIEEQAIRLDNGQEIFLTTSIGIATLQANEQLEHLMQRADMALYTAKQNGRNRVELASESE